jgi:hypothetical protein
MSIAMNVFGVEPPEWPGKLYRLSVEQYDQLARLGVLSRDDRVELIEGLLIEKMTKNERHITTTWLIHRAISRILSDDWFAVTESPMAISRSEPEPDVMVLRGRIEDYFRRKPGAQDVALVVEVADSSYADDRARRAMFAEAGIPFYWIATIPARRMEVHAEPELQGVAYSYRTSTEYGWDDAVPLRIDGQEIARLPVKNLMPPPEA